MNKLKEKIRANKQYEIRGIVIVIALLIVLIFINSKQEDTVIKETLASKHDSSIKEEGTQTQEYQQLEQLFGKYESKLSPIVEGFNRIGMLSGDSDIEIFLKEDSNGQDELRWMGQSQEDSSNKEHQCSIETFNKIKQDQELCYALKTMSKDNAIEEVAYDSTKKEVRFYLFSSQTPYISEQNGLRGVLIYSYQEDAGTNKYQQIKKNWYMMILPKAE